MSANLLQHIYQEQCSFFIFCETSNDDQSEEEFFKADYF